MKYASLGRSALKASAIGFGAWAIGGRQWGKVDDVESVAAIERAVELGINFFDTADIYGFGHSEELLGGAIGNRSDIIIATKVGLGWNAKGKIRHDLSAVHIRSSCEASLRRLKREAIDLYQIHWPDPARPLDEAIDVLDALVKEGKARYIGASNLSIDDIEKLSEKPWFVAYQGLFNWFARDAAENIIPFCRQNNIAFIAYEPLAKGLLTGKFKESPIFSMGDHRKYEERFGDRFFEYRAKVDAFSKTAAKKNVTVAQLALSWALANGATVAIPGMKTAVQVEENAGAASMGTALPI